MKKKILKTILLIMLFWTVALAGCDNNAVVYEYNNSDVGSGVSISKSVYGNNELKVYIKGIGEVTEVKAYDSAFNEITDMLDIAYKNKVLTIKGDYANAVSGLYLEDEMCRYHIRYLDSDEYAMLHEENVLDIGWTTYGDQEKYYTSDEIAEQIAKEEEAKAIQEENFKLVEGVWECENDSSLYMKIYLDENGYKVYEWNEKDNSGKYVTSSMCLTGIDIYETERGIILTVEDNPTFGLSYSYGMSDDKKEIIKSSYGEADDIYVKKAQ